MSELALENNNGANQSGQVNEYTEMQEYLRHAAVTLSAPHIGQKVTTEQVTLQEHEKFIDELNGGTGHMGC